MQWVKKLWFPVSAAVLIALIGYNLFTVVRLRQATNNRATQDENIASQGSGMDGSGTRATVASADKKPASQDLVGQPGPRTIVLRLKPKTEGSQVDAEKLTTALGAIGPVDDASLEAGTLKLTIRNSLGLSELEEPLGFHEVGIADEESSLAGGLRLRVSGMT